MSHAVELVELGKALFDTGAPLVEIEPVPGAKVDAREMPVAKEFRDVRDFVRQFGDIHAEPAELPQHLAGSSEQRQRPPIQILVSAVEITVQPAVHDAEFLQL